MRWAINQITLHGGSRTAPADLPAELAALREAGWRAIELWLSHWDAYVGRHGLTAARRLLDESGLVAAGGCGLRDGPGEPVSLYFSEGEALRQSHAALERRLEQCQALGATHLVTSPGFTLPEAPVVAHMEHAAESLGRASAAAARYGVRLGIEFLALAKLVNTLEGAWRLCRRVDHPNLGIVLDTYHLYAGRSKTEDLALLQADRSRLFYVHVSDVDARKPRDLWVVPDRTLPPPEGEGGIPNRTLLERAAGLGYDGWVSLELFSADFEARWEHDRVSAARAAYARCVSLWPDDASV